MKFKMPDGALYGNRVIISAHIFERMSLGEVIARSTKQAAEVMVRMIVENCKTIHPQDKDGVIEIELACVAMSEADYRREIRLAFQAGLEEARYGMPSFDIPKP